MVAAVWRSGGTWVLSGCLDGCLSVGGSVATALGRQRRAAHKPAALWRWMRVPADGSQAGSVGCCVTLGQRCYATRQAGYLHHYGLLKNHEAMLRDASRVESYLKALEACGSRLQGATVLDVGAGSAVLALLAAKAGAGRVYAVEASPAMARVASRLVRANGLVGVVEVIPKHLEDVTDEEILPGSVDVIISELFSHFLVGEVGLPVVTRAKARFLKPNGLVLPSFARLSLSPFQDRALGVELRTQRNFWRSTDYYGLDLSAAMPIAEEQARKQNVVDLVDPATLLVPPAESPFHELNLAAPNDPESWRNISFELTFPERHKNAVVDGLCGWWDAEFSGVCKGQVPVLSTAPGALPTVWVQCRFLLDRPMAVDATARLTCSCDLRMHDARDTYHLHLVLRNHATGEVRRTGPIELGNVYVRRSAARAGFRPK
eukprot:TRINITY_DN45979_c0_g1_i1.p1 TRINITY_DN45979_c0_g1~~TRINITY_DN45979_c0_g1_i1.p1  ORF type:complete len:432 (+),score=56.95 TRINITY_DN45979_c0_g1_i1:36-1331(+)